MMIRVAALALVLLAAPALACERGTLTGHVTYVRDGDTIEFDGMAIRLQGLAAPEGDERGGDAATKAMRELVEGRLVRCELDGSKTHDRCVAVCYLEGVDIAEALVIAGSPGIGRSSRRAPCRGRGAGRGGWGHDPGELSPAGVLPTAVDPRVPAFG